MQSGQLWLLRGTVFYNIQGDSICCVCACHESISVSNLGWRRESEGKVTSSVFLIISWCGWGQVWKLVWLYSESIIISPRPPDPPLFLISVRRCFTSPLLSSSICLLFVICSLFLTLTFHTSPFCVVKILPQHLDNGIYLNGSSPSQELKGPGGVSIKVDFAGNKQQEQSRSVIYAVERRLKNELRSEGRHSQTITEGEKIQDVCSAKAERRTEELWWFSASATHRRKNIRTDSEKTSTPSPTSLFFFITQHRQSVSCEGLSVSTTFIGILHQPWGFAQISKRSGTTSENPSSYQEAGDGADLSPRTERSAAVVCWPRFNGSGFCFDSV